MKAKLIGLLYLFLFILLRTSFSHLYYTLWIKLFVCLHVQLLGSLGLKRDSIWARFKLGKTRRFDKSRPLLCGKVGTRTKVPTDWRNIVPAFKSLLTSESWLRYEYTLVCKKKLNWMWPYNKESVYTMLCSRSFSPTLACRRIDPKELVPESFSLLSRRFDML